MSDEMKPRVAWIPSNEFCYEEWRTLDVGGYYELVNVIEKSAFDELARKLEIAKRALDRIKRYYSGGLILSTDPSVEQIVDDALKEIER